MEEKRYQLIMTNREHIIIEGVNHVDSFDEAEIILETKMGPLLLKGENLHITQLNLDTGRLEIAGSVKSVDYDEDHTGKGFRNRGKGLLDRILK